MIVQAISLWQPWATLLARGKKKIETRSWPFRRRLPAVLAIHSTKKMDENILSMCNDEEPFPALIRELGYANADELPRGAVVGSSGSQARGVRRGQ